MVQVRYHWFHTLTGKRGVVKGEFLSVRHAIRLMAAWNASGANLVYGPATTDTEHTENIDHTNTQPHLAR